VTPGPQRHGPLSGVATDALRSSYDLAREGSPLAAAELVIEEVPLVSYRLACAAERTPAAPHLCRPACGTPTPEVLSGREREVVALEVEPGVPIPAWSRSGNRS
jgi:hydrogenase nickel incorporation protein HypA/HybF